jgi:putative transposase
VSTKRRSQQKSFVFRTHGGKRAGAGRKRRDDRAGYELHRVRAPLDPQYPVHIVLRAKPKLRVLRAQSVFRAIHRRFVELRRDGFRVVHFSVQKDHIHFIAEGDDAKLLARGVQWLAQHLAWDVNAAMGRAGSVWRDRYHRRDLKSPRQMRNALVYVLMNVRKHSEGAEYLHRMETLDVCSSAAWLDGWDPRAGPMLEELRRTLATVGLATCPVVKAERWTTRAGWKRHGAIRPDEQPRSPS